MKSKTILKSIEKAIERSRIDIKRAKARDDQPMVQHHLARHKALGGT